MSVTTPDANIRNVVASAKNSFPPGNSYFARTKAAMPATTRWPKVPTTVMITVFTRYRLKGTQLWPIVTNRSEKLSIVGWLGHTGGGKRKSSSRGFSEEPIRKNSGNAIAMANRNRIR